MKAIWKNLIESRKLQMFILMFITSTSFFIWKDGSVTFKEWSEFMTWCFGLYCGGNVGEHVSKSIKQPKQ